MEERNPGRIVEQCRTAQSTAEQKKAVMHKRQNNAEQSGHYQDNAEKCTTTEVNTAYLWCLACEPHSEHLVQFLDFSAFVVHLQKYVFCRLRVFEELPNLHCTALVNEEPRSSPFDLLRFGTQARIIL